MTRIDDGTIDDAIRSAARILTDYGTGTTVAEWADTAWDQLDETCYLTLPESVGLEARIVRAVLSVAGFDGGESDARDVPQATLIRTIDRQEATR